MNLMDEEIVKKIRDGQPVMLKRRDSEMKLAISNIDEYAIVLGNIGDLKYKEWEML